MAFSYENLDAWKKSIEFAIFIYKLTRQFPKEELYGLTSQLRRAAVSISSNIAEGSGRRSKKEFLRFVLMSIGSLNETESQIRIAHGLRYVDDEDLKLARKFIEELGNLLGGLRNYLTK